MVSLRPVQQFAVFVCCVATVLGCSKSSEELTEPAASIDTPMASPAAAPQPVVADEKPKPAFYTVSHYDTSRDPVADLASAVSRATSENKRILLQVGGDWCGWCARISEYMAENEAVHDLLDRHFVVMKVTYPGDHAETFLSKFPKCEGYPHLFFLEHDGAFLHSQGTAELEQGKGYDQGVFVRCLSAWIPSTNTGESSNATQSPNQPFRQ